MPVFRVYITYTLPDFIDVEAGTEEEAIELASIEVMEDVNIDMVKFEVEEQEEDFEEKIEEEIEEENE